MDMSDLKSRLDALDRHIKEVEERLKLKGIFSADHQLKASELHERYRLLSQKLEEEVAAEEAQGHHVSDLELSLRQWLDSLEIDMD
jgi:predicted  nucleic acid-binding Zn-ribbon protein